MHLKYTSAIIRLFFNENIVVGCRLKSAPYVASSDYILFRMFDVTAFEF